MKNNSLIIKKKKDKTLIFLLTIYKEKYFLCLFI